MSRDISKNPEINELDWIRVHDEMFKDTKTETFKQKLIRKTSENPAIPIGMIATVAALCGGLYNFYKGNSLMSQYMMRARVAAQGFTLLSIVVGFIVVSKKENE